MGRGCGPAVKKRERTEEKGSASAWASLPQPAGLWGPEMRRVCFLPSRSCRLGAQRAGRDQKSRVTGETMPPTTVPAWEQFHVSVSALQKLAGVTCGDVIVGSICNGENCKL